MYQWRRFFIIEYLITKEQAGALIYELHQKDVQFMHEIWTEFTRFYFMHEEDSMEFALTYHGTYQERPRPTSR